MQNIVQMSKYFESLDPGTTQWYLRKLSVIDGVDPYVLPPKYLVFASLPKVTYFNIVNYLVFQTHTCTSEDFNNYKSMESYNYYASRFVKKVWVHHVNNHAVVLSKVLHSQSLSEKPVEAWFIASPDGTVKTAHCTCMAGLDESCSHVGATLYFVEDVVRNTQDLSVAAYWPVPGLTYVPYARVKDINFGTPANLLAYRYDEETARRKHRGQSSETMKLKPEEREKFLQEFDDAAYRPAVITSVKVVKRPSESGIYPPDLSKMFNMNNRHERLDVLQNAGVCANIALTAAQADALDEATRSQSASSLWFRYRSGRITASNFKAVFKTSPLQPSTTLLKKICYSAKMKFTTKATAWGRHHRGTALKEYQSKLKKRHEYFKTRRSGLIINPQYPHFGASPDAIVQCSCCGVGCVEIKCPYSLCDKRKEEVEVGSPYLILKDGEYCLDEKHEYYFQVKMQLFVSNLPYCDFVMWTKRALLIQRIPRNEVFWRENSETASTFFHHVVMPELLGKYFAESHHEEVMASQEEAVDCPYTEDHHGEVLATPTSTLTSESASSVPLASVPDSLGTMPPTPVRPSQPRFLPRTIASTSHEHTEICCSPKGGNRCHVTRQLNSPALVTGASGRSTVFPESRCSRTQPELPAPHGTSDAPLPRGTPPSTGQGHPSTSAARANEQVPVRQSLTFTTPKKKRENGLSTSLINSRPFPYFVIYERLFNQRPLSGQYL